MFVHEALAQVSNPVNTLSTIVPTFPATQYQEYSLLSPAVFISELLGGKLSSKNHSSHLNSYVYMSVCINNISEL